MDFGVTDADAAQFFIDLIAPNTFIHEQVHRLPKHGCAANTAHLSHGLERSCDVIASYVETPRPRRIDLGHLFQFVRLSANNQLRHVNVTDVIAALGFVHVMRRDEQRHPAGGKFEKQIPKFATRDRIDPRGRFV